MIPLIKNDNTNSSSLTDIPLLNRLNRQNVYIDHNFMEIQSVSIDYYKVHSERPGWKEALDISFGLIGMIIFFVLYPFIALGIKYSSSGPVIFKQKRAGFDGRTFICYKFRTMHNQKPEFDRGEPDITTENDSRVFKFGEFLRKTNLDEMPQFYNVLIGDMSVVGPRPYPVQENSYWDSTFPDFYKRFAVKPGLTGLAQATGFRGGTMNLLHMRERLRRDLVYIEERSLAMDLRVILLTINNMLTFNTKAH